MHWFSKHPLARQLQATFGLILVVLFTANGFTVWTALTSQQADDRVGHVSDLLDLTQSAIIALGDMQVGYQTYLLTGEPGQLERYAADQHAYQNALSQLQMATASPTLLLRWHELQAQQLSLQSAVIEPSIAARQASDPGSATPDAGVVPAVGSQGFEAQRSILDAALTSERTALATRSQLSDAASLRVLVVLIGGMVLATVLAAAIALLLARSIVDALGEMSRTAQRIARGDLSSRVELQRTDEIGQAASAFNEMADHLQVTIDHMDSILNSAGEGIMGSDPQHGFTFVNAAAQAMLGYAPGELAGKRVHSTVHHSLADGSPYPTESCPVHFTLEDGVTRRVADEVMWRKDGTSFPVEYTCGRLRAGEHGHGAVVVFRDISERNRTQEAQRQLMLDLNNQRAELERSNRELQDFAWVAAHDLQEPLRKIRAFGDRLHRRYEPELAAEGGLYLDRMLDAASRMQRLLGDLLVFSRVTTQARPLVELNLTALVREVLVDLEIAVERAGAEVEVCELPTIAADPMQMRQLFQNLLGNGLKFAQPGVTPRLRVTSRPLTISDGVSESSDWYEISVSDNGIGFDEKYLDRIFAIFQRLHGRSDYEGTGIGLAICRKIAEHHGGNITATSTVHRGSTFSVKLPGAPAKRGAARAA